MNKRKIWKGIKKKITIITILSFLAVTPFLWGATSKFVNKEYRYDVILELKYGKKVNQYDGDTILSTTPQYLFDGALHDVQGVKILLDSIKENTLIALYRNEETENYNKIIENEKTRVKSEKESYEDLYGSKWKEKWEKQLKDGNFNDENEYILNKIKSSITKIAFKEIYKSATTKYTYDNGTPDDTSDDKKREYKSLGFNQLFWFNKWFEENRPLHLAELKLNLKSKDDFKDVVMEKDNKIKLGNLIKEIINQKNNSNLEKIDFSGLVAGFSDGTKTNGGNLGIINFSSTTISNIATRYNLYNFINDVSKGTMRKNSEIVLNNNSTSDSFLNTFKTGERNYFYLNLKNEKFLVSRNEKTSISIFRIFGIKNYIDKETKKESTSLIDYFKDSPKIFKDFPNKPFQITEIINNYITSSHPYHAYVLAMSKGIINFENDRIVKGLKMKDRLSNYLNLIESARKKEQTYNFIKTIKDQNKNWIDSDKTNSTINMDNLNNFSTWTVWGV